MKNLYRINVIHAAPKDIHRSIQGYVIASGDEDIFNYIDRTLMFGIWTDKIIDGDVKTDFSGDENVQIPFKEFVMKNKGTLTDDDYSDAYYGITKYGWEEIKSTITSYELDSLKRLGIAIEI